VPFRADPVYSKAYPESPPAILLQRNFTRTRHITLNILEILLQPPGNMLAVEQFGVEKAQIILGIKAELDCGRCAVKLTQKAHTEKFLNAFGFDVCATALKKTPLPLNLQAEENTGRRVGQDDRDYFMTAEENW
jgi:hypothetical protein